MRRADPEGPPMSNMYPELSALPVATRSVSSTRGRTAGPNEPPAPELLAAAAGRFRVTAVADEVPDESERKEAEAEGDDPSVSELRAEPGTVTLDSAASSSNFS